MRGKTTTISGLSASEIGKTLADARKSSGMSQYAMADLLGVSQRSVAAYEKGRRRIHAELLLKYAEITKLSLDRLIRTNSPEFDGRTKCAKAMKKIEKLPAEERKAIFTLIDSMGGKRTAT